MEAMAGKVEIGYVVADAFGLTGAALVGGMLGILLVSTVSAMLLAGPRALQVMGEDFQTFAALSKTTKKRHTCSGGYRPNIANRCAYRHLQL